MKPLIIINFKLYNEAAGDKAVILAKKLDKVKSRKYTIAIAPSLLTLREVIKSVKMPVLAQHADPIFLGAHTGSISPQELQGSGGIILNHSERKIPMKKLKETVELCKKFKLKTVICASSISEVKKICKMNPNYIAYEPKKLIGGEISVTKSKPAIILKAVETVKKFSKKTKVLCGAGIHSSEDIKQALLLGTSGVLIGHAVPKAKDPANFLRKLLI